MGNAWTALWAWLQGRSCGGELVLRIEDLDPERSKEVYREQLMEDLNWLGLNWDEGPYLQSQRRALYQHALIEINENGLVYPCYCSRAEIRNAVAAPHGQDPASEYPGTCRNLSPSQRDYLRSMGRRPAFRIRVPARTFTWDDLYQGQVTQELSGMGDFVLQRADGVHAYQLAVVVDDGMMGITHVLRGEDLLPSTARQLWLYELLGLPAPVFTHVPLLYSQNGHRLAKRDASLSIGALRRRGVLPEQIIGYLAFLAGWLEHYEPVSAGDLIGCFKITRLANVPLIVDKLPF